MAKLFMPLCATLPHRIYENVYLGKITPTAARTSIRSTGSWRTNAAVAGSNNMRIALIGVTYPFRGGISHYTTLLCRALREKHEVRFFALKRQYPKLLFPGKTQKDHSQDTLRVYHEACLDSINPLSWITTFKKIRRFRPDFILISWWHPYFAFSFGTLAHLAKRIARIPTCFLCHNVLPHERSRIDRLLLRYAFSSGNGFITHSRKDLDNLLKIRPRTQVRMNPHPTYEIFAAGNAPTGDQAKTKLGLTGKKVLLFFGFVREYKGLKYLLDAMVLLKPAEDYHLLIAGEFYDDPSRYREGLDCSTNKKQLTLVDRYIPNEEIPLYFCAADLVVTPYLSGTQSGVIQIAYAFSKPVVATTVGGIPESVLDGQTGYLVPPADARAIAGAVRRYFECNENEKFKSRIMQERDKYSWDRMVGTIEDIGKELKSRHHR